MLSWCSLEAVFKNKRELFFKRKSKNCFHQFLKKQKNREIRKKLRIIKWNLTNSLNSLMDVLIFKNNLKLKNYLINYIVNKKFKILCQ